MVIQSDRRKITLGSLLRPHAKILTIAVVAVIIEGAANLAEPWPLKVVLDTVLKARPDTGWLHQAIFSAVGTDKIALFVFAPLVVLLMAAAAAISTYTDRYRSSSASQYV